MGHLAFCWSPFRIGHRRVLIPFLIVLVHLQRFPLLRRAYASRARSSFACAAFGRCGVSCSRCTCGPPSPMRTLLEA